MNEYETLLTIADIGGYPISLEYCMRHDKYRVTYGEEVHIGVSRMRAEALLSAAIWHSLECEGKVDEEND
jgi:hypothetical protein